MPTTGFKKILSLLEKMQATWEKIGSSKAGNIKLDESDLHTIREAFIAASKYEDLNDRYRRACQLFYHKDDSAKFNFVKAVKEAVKIMGIVESTTQKGKRERFHPFKKREVYEFYTWPDMFLFEDEDGCYFDEEGNTFGNKIDFKKQIIINMVKEFGFASPRAAEEYLRDTLGLKNVPSTRDHRKTPK